MTTNLRETKRDKKNNIELSEVNNLFLYISFHWLIKSFIGRTWQKYCTESTDSRRHQQQLKIDLKQLFQAMEILLCCLSILQLKQIQNVSRTEWIHIYQLCDINQRSDPPTDQYVPFHVPTSTTQMHEKRQINKYQHKLT